MQYFIFIAYKAINPFYHDILEDCFTMIPKWPFYHDTCQGLDNISDNQPNGIILSDKVVANTCMADTQKIMELNILTLF